MNAAAFVTKESRKRRDRKKGERENGRITWMAGKEVREEIGVRVKK